MKYIKKYENTNERKPQLGDYVLCKELISQFDSNQIDVINFTSNNIGKITDCDGNKEYPYSIEYEYVPQHLIDLKFFRDNTTRNMSRKEIIYFSPNKEELELILRINKYNL